MRASGDNHYNCPVVAYYPELLAANVPALKKTKFLDPYVGLHRHKDFAKTADRTVLTPSSSIPQEGNARPRSQTAYDAYNAYMERHPQNR